MENDKYTTDPFSNAITIGSGLILGDWIDMFTMSPIVGPYCHWPKTEPRYFTVSYE